MRFLVDADLPRRTVRLLRDHGHEAEDVRDAGLGGSPDSEVAARAREKGLCLITGDFDFADVRNYAPEEYAGIIVLKLPPDATAGTILALVEALLNSPEVLERLPGRLAVVEPGRVRLRPA